MNSDSIDFGKEYLIKIDKLVCDPLFRFGIRTATFIIKAVDFIARTVRLVLKSSLNLARKCHQV